MLYAQVKQADAAHNRNILLAEAKGQYVASKQWNIASFLARRSEMPARSANSLAGTPDAPARGSVGWCERGIQARSDQFGLAGLPGCVVLAVEVMPRYEQYICFGNAPDTS